MITKTRNEGSSESPVGEMSVYRLSYDGTNKTYKLIDYKGEQPRDGGKYIMVPLGDVLLTALKYHTTSELSDVVIKFLKKNERK